MHDVFISYSSKNKTMADAVCQRLESKGIKCWYAPRDVSAGAHWEKAIANGISNAKVFVLIFSIHSNASDHVAREISLAVSKKCFIIPLRIDDSELSDDVALNLQNIHWLDAISGDMEENIAKLETAVRQKLDSSILQGQTASQHQTQSKEICNVKATVDNTPVPVDEKAIEEILADNKVATHPRKYRKYITVLFAIVVTIFLGCIIVSEFTDNSTSQQYETIPFSYMWNLDAYDYPFDSLNGFSFELNTMFLQNKETHNIKAVKTSTGEFLKGHKEIEFEEGTDYSKIRVFKSEDSDIIYFADCQSEKTKVRIYDNGKREWLNQSGVIVDQKSDEMFVESFAQLATLESGGIDSDDMFFLVYDFGENANNYTKIVHITPEGNTKYITLNAAGFKLTRFVCTFAMKSSDGTVPLLFWDNNDNLRLIDMLTGKRIDVSYETLAEDYMPYANEVECISPNKKYILKTNFNKYEDDTSEENVSVWSVEAGSKVFDEDCPGDTWAYFKEADNESEGDADVTSLLLYTNQTLRRIDIDSYGSIIQNTVLIESSLFQNNTDEFPNIPYKFYYSKKLRWCFWNTAYTKESKVCIKLTVTDIDGNILYRTDGISAPYDSWTTNYSVFDDIIVYGVRGTTNEGTSLDTPTTLINIVTYTTDKNDGRIQLRNPNAG